MTAELLTSLAAILLSLLFAYLPGLETWYARLDGAAKRLLMLALLALTAAGAFGLGCTTWGPLLGVNLTCDQPGAAGLAQAFILALIANQSTYLLAVRR